MGQNTPRGNHLNSPSYAPERGSSYAPETIFSNPCIVTLTFDLVIPIHAICPGGTEKSRNFDPSKPVPAGRHFSRKICFVPESCQILSICGLSNALHFQTSGLAIKTIITRSGN